MRTALDYYPSVCPKSGSIAYPKRSLVGIAKINKSSAKLISRSPETRQCLDISKDTRSSPSHRLLHSVTGRSNLYLKTPILMAWSKQILIGRSHDLLVIPLHWFPIIWVHISWFKAYQIHRRQSNPFALMIDSIQIAREALKIFAPPFSGVSHTNFYWYITCNSCVSRETCGHG